MIVVTGAARTGTSMMMQTLVNLGIPTPASKFINQHDPIIEYNEKGFYEMYNEVIGGIQHSEYKGQAVKLFAGQLVKTPKHLIDHIIVMRRNIDDSCKSSSAVFKALGSDIDVRLLYDSSYSIIYNYINGVKHIFVNFEDMVQTPDFEIDRLVSFLGLKPKNEQVERSIKNIDLWQF